MADVWFRKLGFSRNPFSIKPAAFNYELFGVSSEGLISGIEDGKVLFVEAPIGYGKTTLLKSIIHRFGGKNKVIYAHAIESEMIGLRDLLKRSSLANFITGNLPERMILVVDEAQNLAPESSSEIMEFYKSGNIKAIIFFGTKYFRDSFGGEFGKLLNGNLVHLSKPTPEQAVSIIRSRIGSLPMLSNNAIVWAYKRSQGSPRQLLQICEDICRSAVEKGNFTVSTEGDAIETVSDEKQLAEPKPEVKHRVVPEITAEPLSESSVSTSASLVKTKKPRRAKRKVVAKAATKSPKHVKAVKSAKAKPVARAEAKSKKQKNSKPAAAATQTIEVQDTTATEGQYWGEFMGMQK